MKKDSPKPYKNQGMRIRQKREAEGMTIEQLAEKMGVSYQSAQQWELGQTSPRPKRLETLAEHLRTTVQYITTGASSKSVNHTAACKIDAFEIRKNNLRRLIQTHYDNNQAIFAEAVDMTPSYISQILTGHRNIGERTARKIERIVGEDAGHLDVDASAPTIKSLAQQVGEQILAANPEVQRFFQGLLTRNESDQIEIVKAIYTLLKK